jgi:hypothetical protein
VTMKTAQCESSTNKTMNKRSTTRSASLDSSIDNTSSHALANFALSKYDVIPLILAILVVILCLTSCLVSYYAVQAQEVQTVTQSMVDSRDTLVTALQAAMDSVLINMDYVKGFFQLQSTIPDMSTQFIPFVSSHGNTFPAYLGSVSYLQRVLDVDRTNFTTTMKAKGGVYSNFTIFYLNAVSAKVTMPYASE